MRAFRLAYDGRPFRGFQRQPDVRTVEGELLGALAELGVARDEDIPPGYAAAGRTDAGVSGVRQTVAFDCPDWCTPRAINGALPEPIRAWASAEVPEGFHATHDAVRREYTYFQSRRGADLERARAAAARLAGQHDFHNLTPDDEGTVRELEIDIEPAGDFLALTVAAGGFPRQLVRRLATLVETVATGEQDLAFVDRALEPEPLEGRDGVGPAPAAGLVLTAVDYPGVSFAADGEAVADARRIFADRAWAARTEGRALSSLVDGLDG